MRLNSGDFDANKTYDEYTISMFPNREFDFYVDLFYIWEKK